MMAAAFAPLLIIAVALPLLAPLALWWPRGRETVLRRAWLTALPALLLALWGDGGLSLRLDWLLLGAEFSLAGSSRIFLLLTAWLWLLAAWFAAAYLAHDRRAHNFLIFFFLAMAGNFGLILAQDLISFNVFFSLMGLSAYGLVVHNRDYAALRAGRIYLMLVVAGEVLIFIGLVGWVWQTGGAVQLAALAGAGRLPAPLVGCLLLGFGIKAGMLPLHGWLPLAHPAAPVPASAVLSGAMIKAGLLGWLRFLPSGEQGVPALPELMLLLGLTGAVYGVIRGLRQADPKTILAWSSISQMGLLTVGLSFYLAGGAARGPALTAIEFYVVHHGLAKGALFLAVAAGLRGCRRLLPATGPGPGRGTADQRFLGQKAAAGRRRPAGGPAGLVPSGWALRPATAGLAADCQLPAHRPAVVSFLKPPVASGHHRG
ncbi:MAG: complex I subunit 5 family protein [Desulfurivibrio sp.]|nr:complex I subunit 5 family protein [Desulfurivibrio sp.]